VAELLTEMAQTFEPLAKSRGSAFHVTDASGGAALTGHRKSLAGALTNLLENALQAVELHGSGRIDLDARRDGALLLLSVRDNGRGMNAETAARLFDPFFTTRAEGTGLGLSIARGVARAHGGGIEVISSTGAGAEFILTLPCPNP
jgi:two-component system sensor histidine kinase FlrB